MTRIRGVSEDAASPEQQRLFDGDRALFGAVLNPSRVYAHRADVFLAVQELHGTLAESSTLPPGVVALARLRVAQLHASPFWLDLIAAGPLRPGSETEPTEDERAVLAFAEGMADPTKRVDDDVFARVRELFGDAGAVELGAWIGLQSLYSSFNSTFGIEAQGFGAR